MIIKVSVKFCSTVSRRRTGTQFNFHLSQLNTSAEERDRRKKDLVVLLDSDVPISISSQDSTAIVVIFIPKNLNTSSLLRAGP